MNFLYRLRESFARMMVGRYGMDDLSRFMLFIFFALVVVQIFLRNRIINGVEMIFVILLYFRMFSRNFQARRRENDLYLKIKNKIFRRSNNGGYNSSNNGYSNGNTFDNDFAAKMNRERMRRQNEDRANYKYFNCPSCNQRMRVPKGKGKIEITCSKCGHVFNKRS